MRGIHGRVVGSIGEGIIKGRYPPGSLLPREPELIAKFGVSRTALREALKVLAAKGLVSGAEVEECTFQFEFGERDEVF